jgi:predicted ATPase/uncharacterized protein HemY
MAEGHVNNHRELGQGRLDADTSSLRELLDATSKLPRERALRISLGIVGELMRRPAGGACPEVRPQDVIVTVASGRVRGVTLDVPVASGQRLTGRGSPYVSPEVRGGEAADERTTVWAVGAVLLEMLVGSPPSREQALPDVLEMCPEGPEALATLVYRMLDPDPEMRLQTLEAVRAELASILEAVGGGAGPLDFAGQREAGVRESRDSGAVLGDGRGTRAFTATATSFVGRERELGEIAERLEVPQCRLLTLVGPGGIGKSRLAFEAARRMVGSFDDGVCFVPLGAARSAVFIVFAIGGALELSFSGPRDPKLQLFGYLRDRDVLLVLDDFDRLLEGAGLVTELLGNTRGVKVIVTSRERLGSRAEWLFEVEGLEVPGEEDDTDPREYDSVRLFCECAKRVDAAFDLGEDAKSQAARICRLVEGMPLGIELAAGWTRVLSCEEIAQEIERGVDVLSTRERDVPARHRSIRAALDRSWSLLGREEQDALARLSVFSGGFTREAAAEVAGASLAMLLTLVDKSLVRRDAFGRWQIHELTRQYLEEKLPQGPQESERARQAHCRYYGLLLERLGGHLRGAGVKGAMEQMEDEIGNIQKGWEWAVDRGKLRDIDTYLGPLHFFHDARGWYRQGAETFGRAAASIREATGSSGRVDGESQLVLGRLLARQGVSHYHLGDYGTARTLITDGLGILRHTEDPKETALALRSLANVARRQGKYEEARQLCEECLEIGREAADRRTEARALDALGTIAIQLGKYDEAKALHEEALGINRATDDLRGIAECLNSLGNIAHNVGNAREAKRCYEEALLIAEELGDRAGVCARLTNLGMVAVMLGEYTEARELLEESLEIARSIGDEYAVAHGLYTLGETCFEFGEHDEAKRVLEESLAVFRRIGDRRAAAYCLTTLGTVLSVLGDHGGAERAHRSCLAIVRELGVRRVEAASLYGLGEVALAAGEVESSVDLFRQALRVADEVKAIPLALAILLPWARAFEHQGNTATAAELYSFISHHESSRQSVVDHSSKALSDLAPRLSADELEAAAARGKARTFEDVAKELLDSSG